MLARSIPISLLSLLYILSAAGLASGQSPLALPAIQPYVGDWVGEGWGNEVRFLQSQSDFVHQFPGAKDLQTGPDTDKTIMSLTVRHITHFHFVVDETGAITGEGDVTYDLFPNLCGLAALTKQVNDQINLMSKIPTIFKMATDIGISCTTRFNQEFYQEESKLSAQVEDIVTKAKNFQAAGGPGNPNVDDPTLATSLLLKKGQTQDVKDLVTAVVLGRCGSNPTYRISGSSRACLDLLVRPGTKSIQDAGETAFNASLKLEFDMLKSTTKSKLQNLDLQAQQEVAACSGGGNALRGGTMVGPADATALSKDLAANGTKAMMDMATGSAPVSLMLSIPGVTQVQYYYKGLPNGAESRDFKIKGHLVPAVGGAKIYLQMDGDVTGGDKNLYDQYTVNYRTETAPFPTWSPFLANPGDAQPSGVQRVRKIVETLKPVQYTDSVTGNTMTVNVPEQHVTYDDMARGEPFASFDESGTHRNGATVWHDYEYVWNAWKIMEPPPAGQQ
jgi:hypothetical protein